MNPWTNPEQAERLKAYAEYTRFDGKPRRITWTEVNRRAHPDLFSSVRDFPLDNQNK